jgi:glycosyltransferase involved in cell wall biosynthesis
MDGFRTRDEVFGLESVVDSYISLHRSEGFGLGLAESMSLGKPVIGTAYSGNLEFMDAGNSCLVGYRLVDVGPDEYPYGEGQVWADPDIEVAAHYMKRLVEDSAFAADIGRRASEHMAREFSAEAVGRRIRARMTGIVQNNND